MHLRRGGNIGTAEGRRRNALHDRDSQARAAVVECKRIPLEEATMRLKVDKESDALYFRLDESVVIESEEVQPGIVLDYDAENRVVGIEILGLSARVAPEQLRILQFEMV